MSRSHVLVFTVLVTIQVFANAKESCENEWDRKQPQNVKLIPKTDIKKGESVKEYIQKNVNFLKDEKKGDYCVIQRSDYKGWDIIKCDTKKPFLCESPMTDNIAEYNVCPENWWKYQAENTCISAMTYIDVEMGWHDANKHCKKLHFEATVVVIWNWDKDIFVKYFIEKFSSLHNLEVHKKIGWSNWIGLVHPLHPSVKKAVTFSVQEKKVKKESPELCVELRGDGAWYTNLCTEKNRFVCQPRQ